MSQNPETEIQPFPGITMRVGATVEVLIDPADKDLVPHVDGWAAGRILRVSAAGVTVTVTVRRMVARERDTSGNVRTLQEAA